MAKKKAAGKKKTPQPPTAQQAPPGPVGDGGGGGYNVNYQPTLGEQTQTPYNDAMAAGAYGALPGMYGAVGKTADAASGSLGAYNTMMQQNPDVANAMRNRLLGAYQGNKIFDPYISSQLDIQQQQLHQNLARTLGPDYQATGAGQNALARFQEMRNHTEASAQQQAIQGLNDQWMQMVGNTANQGSTFGTSAYDQGIGLGNAMWGGQGNQQQLAAGKMNLMGGVAGNMMGAGSGLGAMSAGGVNAQGPMQQDKQGQLAASYAPTHKQMMGMNMVQSGNQWSDIGSKDVGFGSQSGGGF